MTREDLRFIRFSVVEIRRGNKRVILDLEDLMGSPPMMESSALILIGGGWKQHAHSGEVSSKHQW